MSPEGFLPGRLQGFYGWLLIYTYIRTHTHIYICIWEREMRERDKFIHTCIHTHTHTHIYIYIEREREKKWGRRLHDIYTYMYTNTHIRVFVFVWLSEWGNDCLYLCIRPQCYFACINFSKIKFLFTRHSSVLLATKLILNGRLNYQDLSTK